MPQVTLPDGSIFNYTEQDERDYRIIIYTIVASRAPKSIPTHELTELAVAIFTDLTEKGLRA